MAQRNQFQSKAAQSTSRKPPLIASVLLIFGIILGFGLFGSFLSPEKPSLTRALSTPYNTLYRDQIKQDKPHRFSPTTNSAASIRQAILDDGWKLVAGPQVSNALSGTRMCQTLSLNYRNRAGEYVMEWGSVELPFRTPLLPVALRPEDEAITQPGGVELLETLFWNARSQELCITYVPKERWSAWGLKPATVLPESLTAFLSRLPAAAKPR